MKNQTITAAALAVLLPATLNAQTVPAPAAPQISATVDSTPPPTQHSEDIIVTGTRQLGRTKGTSPAPVDVISAAELQRTGQQNVFDALNKLLPSFELPAEGFDTAGLVRSARLRGLSPDDTLVLINGKRRHITANINADVGPVGGSDPTDLDLIPISLVDHIEVLRDGAAAQYGSDAIAGVINIILKHSATLGGTAFSQEGATYQQDGFDSQNGVSFSAPIGSNGYFDIAGNYHWHDHTNRTGFDSRAQIGTPSPVGLTAADGLYNVVKNPGRIDGDPRYSLVSTGFNAGYDFGNITLYSFGTYANRSASAFENWRTPGRFDSDFYRLSYPSGYVPREALFENDYAITGGVKGVLPGDWNYDLSTTYGADFDNIKQLDDLNPSLITETGYLINPIPKRVHAGEFNDGEWTSNLDISKPFDLPFFAAPTNLAFGAEYRRDSYQLEAGDFASSFGAGTSAYPGFTSGDESRDHRQNEAVYGDLALTPLPHWQVDLAARFEHYSDVGDTETGKVTTRYDITPRVAVRGTISNGFRAPTLAQEYAAEVNVGPTTAEGQLPVNSSAARSLGSIPLKPERSQNYSVGLVTEPIDRLHIGVDAYQIDIRDQVEDSGLIGASKNVNLALYEKAVAALQSAGFNIADSATFVSAQFYTNGIGTRNRGIDVTADYVTDLPFIAEGAHINWNLAINFNDVELKRVTKFGDGSTEFTPDVLSEITRDAPKNKIILQATYVQDKFTTTLRGSRYGTQSEVIGDQNNGTPYYTNTITPKYIVDLEIGYEVYQGLKLSVGANNLFNVYPNLTNYHIRDFNNTQIYLASSAFGFDGGFYYARLNYAFGAPGAATPGPVALPPIAPAPPPAPTRTYLVFFDWDRADLTQRAKQIVAEAAQAAPRVQTTRIEVNGYTDLSGTAAYNQKLSVRRAKTVEAELVNDGVAESEISIHGYGETSPLVPTANGVREPQNRRVEIILR